MIALGVALQRAGDRIDGGVWSCLSKPVKESELLDAVRSVVGVSSRTRARRAPAVSGQAQRSRLALDILLVEDNPVNRRLAQHVLEKEGYRVVAADNGAAALKTLEDKHFDLILMDVQTSISILSSWTCRCPGWTVLKLPGQFEAGKKLPANTLPSSH